jgi:hypothetical protein
MKSEKVYPEDIKDIHLATFQDKCTVKIELLDNEICILPSISDLVPVLQGRGHFKATMKRKYRHLTLILNSNIPLV